MKIIIGLPRGIVKQTTAGELLILAIDACDAVHPASNGWGDSPAAGSPFSRAPGSPWERHRRPPGQAGSGPRTKSLLKQRPGEQRALPYRSSSNDRS